jgi:ABC-type dipeptide/oligopeptide/nickel transport system permease subunit
MRADLNRIVPPPSLTYWQDAWIKLKKNKVAMLGLAINSLYLLLAHFAPMFSRFDFSSQNAKAMNQCRAGTTSSAPTRGRDLWVRKLDGREGVPAHRPGRGAHNTLIGCLVGGISGLLRRQGRHAGHAVIDVLYGIPMIILAILMRTVMSSGIVPLSRRWWRRGDRQRAARARPGAAVENQEFVMAARTLASVTPGSSSGTYPQHRRHPDHQHDHGHTRRPSSPRRSFRLLATASVAQLLLGFAAQSAIQVYRHPALPAAHPGVFSSAPRCCRSNMLGDGLRDALDPACAALKIRKRLFNV